MDILWIEPGMALENLRISNDLRLSRPRLDEAWLGQASPGNPGTRSLDLDRMAGGEHSGEVQFVPDMLDFCSRSSSQEVH